MRISRLSALPIDPVLEEQISESLFLSIYEIGLSVYVVVWSREGSDIMELVNMEISRGDRTITSLYSELGRVAEVLEKLLGIVHV